MALVPQVATAGDRWQECTMINNAFYEYDGERSTRSTATSAGNCRTRNSRPSPFPKSRAIAKPRTAPFQLGRRGVCGHLDLKGTEGPFSLWALCEEGGSGIPATTKSIRPASRTSTLRTDNWCRPMRILRLSTGGGGSLNHRQKPSSWTDWNTSARSSLSRSPASARVLSIASC